MDRFQQEQAHMMAQHYANSAMLSLPTTTGAAAAPVSTSAIAPSNLVSTPVQHAFPTNKSGPGNHATGVLKGSSAGAPHQHEQHAKTKNAARRPAKRNNSNTPAMRRSSSTSSNPQSQSAAQAQSAHDSHGEGKAGRVVKACERCRSKKTKCDGIMPCKRCRDDDHVCVMKKRGLPFKKMPEGYAEVLENTHVSQVLIIRKLFKMIEAGERWTAPRPQFNSHGEPSIHDIATALKCVRVIADPEAPFSSGTFPENDEDLHAVADKVAEYNVKREADEALRAAQAADEEQAMAALAAQTAQLQSQSQSLYAQSQAAPAMDSQANSSRSSSGSSASGKPAAARTAARKGLAVRPVSASQITPPIISPMFAAGLGSMTGMQQAQAMAHEPFSSPSALSDSDEIHGTTPQSMTFSETDASAMYNPMVAVTASMQRPDGAALAVAPFASQKELQQLQQMQQQLLQGQQMSMQSLQPMLDFGSAFDYQQTDLLGSSLFLYGGSPNSVLNGDPMISDTPFDIAFDGSLD